MKYLLLALSARVFLRMVLVQAMEPWSRLLASPLKSPRLRISTSRGRTQSASILILPTLTFLHTLPKVVPVLELLKISGTYTKYLLLLISLKKLRIPDDLKPRQKLKTLLNGKRTTQMELIVASTLDSKFILTLSAKL